MESMRVAMSNSLADTVAPSRLLKSRGAATRWAVFGIVVGVLAGVVAFAPAAWLAGAIASATSQHLLLADARGTVWSGSAVVVLTGGPGSRDASALPGRLDWTVGLKGLALELRARQACCINGTASLLVRPGLGRVTLSNYSATPGRTVSADAARIGGGMGHVVRGSETSRRPRWTGRAARSS